MALMVTSLMLSLVLIYWGATASDINSRQRRIEMQRAAFDASNYLVRNLIVNETNVFDQNKVYSFVGQDYTTAKNQIGVEGYEFYFQLTGNSTGGIVQEVVAYIATQDPNDVEIMKMLNKSDLIWDFYWGKREDAPATNARFVYDNIDKVPAYKMLIANISSYKTIISEDSHVEDNDLTNAEQNALRNFVNAGHTYIHVQHKENLLNIFSGLTGSGNNNKGTVVNLDPILKNAIIGEQINFQQGTQAFPVATSPLPLKVIMEVTGDSSKCIFCKWTYGKGPIYYFPDASDSGGQQLNILNVATTGTKAGKLPPQNATETVVVRRVGVYNGEPAVMLLYVWK